MNYHQLNAYLLSKDLSQAKAATAKWKVASKAAANITREEIFDCITAIDPMKMELSVHNMYAFAKLEDGDYQKYFLEKYSKFTMAVDFILPREYISQQYETFKTRR